MIKRKDIIKIKPLLYWLTTPTEKIFERFEFDAVYSDDPTRHYIHIDNGSSVLYVAHLDTVQELNEIYQIRIGAKSIQASGLDDRLGVYLAFMLNELGMKGDILLTDHEEIGCSTAKYFKTNKKYNWVCELDRGGEDFVTYGEENKRFINLLLETGAERGLGSYSDISVLELDNHPCMFNLGIGYYRPHSLNSFARIPQLLNNVNRFKEFYERYHKVKFWADERVPITIKNGTKKELDFLRKRAILFSQITGTTIEQNTITDGVYDYDDIGTTQFASTRTHRDHRECCQTLRPNDLGIFE